MILDFESVRIDEQLTIEVRADVLILNAERHDFTPLPEGGTVSWEAIGSQWICSDAIRESGQVRVTVILPCGPQAPVERRFMETRYVSEDGVVPLPPYGEA